MNIPKNRLLIENNKIAWSNDIRYFYVSFISGKCLICDFHLLKSKLFGSVDSILSKLLQKLLLLPFPPARQGTILNNHRVIGIAANTSMVLNCTLLTYIMITANAGLPVAV